MKQIWHLGPWGPNLGACALRDSIRHHLTRACGGPLEYVPEYNRYYCHMCQRYE